MCHFRLQNGQQRLLRGLPTRELQSVCVASALGAVGSRQYPLAQQLFSSNQCASHAGAQCSQRLHLATTVVITLAPTTLRSLLVAHAVQTAMGRYKTITGMRSVSWTQCNEQQAMGWRDCSPAVQVATLAIPSDATRVTRYAQRPYLTRCMVHHAPRRRTTRIMT